MTTDRQRNKIRVYDGSLVDPYNLKPSDMKPFIFMHSISLLNRFHGHSVYPYSVGQHTCNLVRLVPRELKPAALIHDFSEAMFNDLASPVKSDNPDYKAAEHKCGEEIAAHFGVPAGDMEELDWYDKSIYVNERDALFNDKLFEQGRGDELTGLPQATPDLFKETTWRKVQARLQLLWLVNFPEFDMLTGEKF